MATSLGEGKLWIQTTCRPGKGWSLPSHSCPRHTTLVNGLMGHLKKQWNGTWPILIQILTPCVESTQNSMFYDLFFSDIEMIFTGKERVFKH